MNWKCHTVWTLVGCGLAGAVRADLTEPSTDAPNVVAAYAPIVSRNAFRLKPPPPPEPEKPPEKPPEPPPTLKLTGITTFLSGKRALFMAQDPKGPKYYSLPLWQEGGRGVEEDGLRVLEINEKAGAVRVLYGGKELAMNFAEHGLKAPVGPAATPTPVPGQPNTPPQLPAVPGMTTAAFGGAAATMASANLSGLRQLPSRPTRLEPGATGPSSGASIGFSANTPGSVTVVQHPPETGLSAEQKEANMLIQHEVFTRAGIPMPPLPPGVGGDSGVPSPPSPGDTTVPMPPTPSLPNTPYQAPPGVNPLQPPPFPGQ